MLNKTASLQLLQTKPRAARGSAAALTGNDTAIPPGPSRGRCKCTPALLRRSLTAVLQNGNLGKSYTISTFCRPSGKKLAYGRPHRKPGTECNNTREVLRRGISGIGTCIRGQLSTAVHRPGMKPKEHPSQWHTPSPTTIRPCNETMPCLHLSS